MKFQEKLKAIALRRKGLSYSAIKRNVKVSRSTLSLWLQDIPLTPVQKNRLLKSKDRGRYLGSETQRLKRINKTVHLLATGSREFGELCVHPLFLCGLALYWAEGDKHKAESVKFTNSDPAMIMFMMKWFREICSVPEEKFRIALHIHNLHVSKNVEKYWSKVTGIPGKQFHKTYIKKSSLHQRKKILYNGTCAIIIHNKDLFRRIMGWKEGLLAHFGLSPRSSMDRTRDF